MSIENLLGSFTEVLSSAIETIYTLKSEVDRLNNANHELVAKYTGELDKLKENIDKITTDE